MEMPKYQFVVLKLRGFILILTGRQYLSMIKDWFGVGLQVEMDRRPNVTASTDTGQGG